MRIALVAEDYYPQLGGVPEHVHNLALQLISWGHHVHVITAKMRETNADAPFVRRVGTSVVIYSNGGVARVTVGWRLQHQLEQLFRAERYDVVHVHGGLAPTFGVVAPLAAWRVGIPVVATFHSWFPRSVGLRVFRPIFQRLIDRHAATIAVSTPVIEAMSRYVHADWEIIPNGVNTTFFQPNGRRPIDALRRGPRLLFLGRLEPRNGLNVLLEAMPQVLRRFPNAVLTVAGDGPWRGYYERRARALGLGAGGRIRFVGRVFQERPLLYAAADLYLCPTTRASFGVTLLESMACGTPMVLADNVGFRSVVREGREAVFLSDQRPEVWADAVVGLVADVERRAAMARAGIDRASEFAWPLVARRELEVYERVTGLSEELRTSLSA